MLDGPIKWVVLEDETLRVARKRVGLVEVTHAVLAGGAPVRGAGEAEIYVGDGVFFGLRISNHSGHYKPQPECLALALELFARLGVQFDDAAIERVHHRR